MAIYAFEDRTPVIGEGTYVHPDAVIIGDVVIGKNCFIAPNATLRADWGSIRIGDNCNIQDNCIIHVGKGNTCVLEDMCHIAHGTVIHGAHLEKECFVGMNCLILDNAVIHYQAALGANTMVLLGREIPENTLVTGQPANRFMPIDEKRRAKINSGRALYMGLPERYRKGLKRID